MPSPLEFDVRIEAPRRVPFPSLGERYNVIGALRGTGRAKVSLALPAGARHVDELVVIKRYGEAGSDAELRPLEIPPEVEVASAPRHENLVRVVECGWEEGGHFVVSEYLDGATLGLLLRGLSAQARALPSAALVRILLGLFGAVEHANRWTRKPEARRLVHQPIGVSDVFITGSGGVKVLGFKPRRARAVDGRVVPPELPNAEATSAEATSAEVTAVEALLSSPSSPELATALARAGGRTSATSLLGLWRLARALNEWRHEALQSDGRAELAEVMAALQPDKRAQRRAQLEAAIERAVRASAAGEAPPVSGFRFASPSAAARSASG